MSIHRSGPAVPDTSPPMGMAGGLVPWALVFERSPNVYAVLQSFETFPSGVRFSLKARFRPGAFDPLGAVPGAPGGPHIEVAFPDGRVGTVTPGTLDPGPGSVVLRYCRGSGGADEWTMDLWLSPLPPVGPLTFTLGWPEKGAPVASVTVAAEELVDAAKNAERLWEPSQGDAEPGAAGQP